MIYKGDDKEITITITRDGSALDLTSVTGILVYVYQIKDQPAAKFSRDALAGHGDVVVTDAVNGEVVVRLNRSVTNTLNVGKLYLEVKVKEADADFEDSDFETIASEVFIDTVDDSSSGEVDGY